MSQKKSRDIFLIAVLVVFTVENICFISYCYKQKEYNQQCELSEIETYLGDWVITELIPGGRFSNPTESIDVIGSTVSLSKSQLLVNGVQCVQNPLYIAKIIPMTRREEYYKDFGPLSDNDIFDSSKDYFVHINIEESIERFNFDESNALWAVSFYIRSENELVFNGISNGVSNLYRAERISNPEISSEEYS